MKLDGHGYSPTIFHRILHIAGVTSAFDVAETALKVVGEISISARQINNLANEVGQEMAADRDVKTAQYVNAPLPRQPSDGGCAAGFGDGLFRWRADAHPRSRTKGEAFTSRTGARRKTRASIA